MFVRRVLHAVRVVSFGFGAIVIAPRLFAQPARVGGEFQVNTYTTSYQNRVAVAMENSGDFVVVWHSGYQDGDLTGVFGQRFSQSGARQGSEFRVNSYTVTQQARPQIAMDDDGDFVVVWFSFSAQDGNLSGVFGQRFNSTGTAQAAEFQINTYTTAGQLHPKAAMDADGDFVVVWFSVGQDGDGSGVFGKRFNSAGAAQATEFQVNTYTTGDQNYPAIAIGPTGPFVVAWHSDAQDGDVGGIFAQRFGATGVKQGGEFQVNAYTTSYQARVEVARDDDGDFVVVWHSGGQDGDLTGAFGQRFSATGVRQGGEFQINTRTTSYQNRPKVAIDSAGNFEVIWYSVGQDGDLSGVFGQDFNALGVRQGGEFHVSSYTVGSQNYPAVAMAANGDFVVAWQSFAQDGSNYGAFAQRLMRGVAAGPELDVDGDGSLGALTDGLLVLRYLFGFSDATLINGAVGGGCTRCNAVAIDTYLDGLGLTIDIDGNLSPDALTDGLLVLRYLFGFSGATLINGAVGAGCTRCDAAMIDTYLDGLAS